MIKMVGNDIWRGGEKVGYVLDTYVYDGNGAKQGYLYDVTIYDYNNHKLAYIDGNYLYSEDSARAKVSLNDIDKEIGDGVLSLEMKCAVYVLIGA